jgi:hypothetical protein
LREVATTEVNYASDHPYAYGPAKVIAWAAAGGAILSVAGGLAGAVLLRQMEPLAPLPNLIFDVIAHLFFWAWKRPNTYCVQALAERRIADASSRGIGVGKNERRPENVGPTGIDLDRVGRAGRLRIKAILPHNTETGTSPKNDLR